MPSGSSPFTGSSNSSTSGSPSSAAAIPSRWPMPRENFPGALAGDRREPDDVEHLVDASLAGCDSSGRASADGLGRCGPGGSPSPPTVRHLAQRPRQVVVVLPVHRDVARGRRVEPHDHAHRRRLARAVRPEESRHDARSNGEAQLVDGELCRRSASSVPWPRSSALSRRGRDSCSHL